MSQRIRGSYDDALSTYTLLYFTVGYTGGPKCPVLFLIKLSVHMCTSKACCVRFECDSLYHIT